MLTRIYGISDPTEPGDPRYVDGVKTALSAAVDYALVAIESGEQNAPAIPSALLSQARLAAQHRIPVDIVLRRYIAGFTLLSDFVLKEASESEPTIRPALLQPLLRSHAVLFDRLLDAVSDEHRRASDELRVVSLDLRRLERLRRLLAGELLDTSEFGYPFEGWHLGVLAAGREAMTIVKHLASAVDRRLLAVQPDDDTVWAWLGGRERLDSSTVDGRLSSLDSLQLRVAIGEPGQSLAGWRLTHSQATAALLVAQRGKESPVRYAEVALLAALHQDDVLTASLHQIYLAPLRHERDGGDVARQTLRAYFSAGRNVTATAAALKLNRNTVTTRLRSIEKRIGRTIEQCATDLDVALRLEELA